MMPGCAWGPGGRGPVRAQCWLITPWSRCERRSELGWAGDTASRSRHRPSPPYERGSGKHARRGWAVNRSVPQTLHRVFEQELTSLLDIVLAGDAVPDRATAERLVRALGAISHVHQRHIVDSHSRCQLCWSIDRRWWRSWPRRTECSVHAALSFFSTNHHVTSLQYSPSNLQRLRIHGRSSECAPAVPHPRTTGGHHMIPANWPYSPETYEAFAAMNRAGFTHYCCGDRRAPHVLVSTYDWGDYIDVINVRGADRVTSARLPKHDDLDIFAPTQAVWHYMGALEPTVASTLRLPPPDHPDAPTTSYRAPISLFVSSREQRSMTVKPGRQT